MARATPSQSPTDSVPPAPPPVFGRRATPGPRPLAGVTCPVLTAAIRRVEERWTREQSDDDERGTLVAQPRHEQIAIGMKLQGERRLAGAHTQRATQGVILPSYHHYSGKHRDLRV